MTVQTLKTMLVLYIYREEISAEKTGWYKITEVEGVKANFQLDTGVKCNIISHNVFKTPHGMKITKSVVKLTSYAGQTCMTHTYTRAREHTNARTCARVHTHTHTTQPHNVRAVHQSTEII